MNLTLTVHTDPHVSTVHLHLDPAGVAQRLEFITTQLSAILAQGQHMTADEQAALDAANTKLDALATKDDAMTAALQTNTTVLQGLSAEIAALKLQTNDPAVVAGLTAIGTKLDAHLAKSQTQLDQLAADDTANAP